MSKLTRWLEKHSPIAKAYRAGRDDGRAQFKREMEEGRVVWAKPDIPYSAWIDKPATMAAWRDAALREQRWFDEHDASTSRHFKYWDVPYNRDNLDAYAEIFPEMKRTW